MNLLYCKNCQKELSKWVFDRVLQQKVRRTQVYCNKDCREEFQKKRKTTPLYRLLHEKDRRMKQYINNIIQFEAAFQIALKTLPKK